jgi:phosphoglycerate dehydrogenase-like enzyme
VSPKVLLPDGEISDGVRAILPDGEWLLFSDAERGTDVSGVELYVPPYMRWADSIAMMNRLPNLRAVQLLTAGIDWIAPHVPPGVMLCRGIGVHEASVTELVLTLALAMSKDVPDFVRHQAKAQWKHRRTGGLYGSKAVILGHGAIGRATGAMLEALGVEVVGVSRAGRPPSVGLSALADVLPTCDVFVILLPLTDETRGLVDAEMLGMLPDGALVINVSRGQAVDSAALERELVSGRLRAGLDVTEPEPLPAESPLWHLPNVLITPHVGGDSDLFPRFAARLVAEQMTRYLEGRPLEHEVVGSY